MRSECCCRCRYRFCCRCCWWLLWLLLWWWLLSLLSSVVSLCAFQSPCMPAFGVSWPCLPCIWASVAAVRTFTCIFFFFVPSTATPRRLEWLLPPMWPLHLSSVTPLPNPDWASSPASHPCLPGSLVAAYRRHCSPSCPTTFVAAGVGAGLAGLLVHKRRVGARRPVVWVGVAAVRCSELR